MIERVQLPDGRVVDREVRPDDQQPLRVAEVVSLGPVVVEVDGQRRQLHKRLASVNVGNVQVGALLLVCRTEAGVIAVGEVI
jgi:hypothetical protein